MITFNSQEDFEKAVIAVLKNKITIDVSLDKRDGGDYYRYTEEWYVDKVEVLENDN